MPQQPLTTIENNFVGGLKTEFTGLNFPENSVTDSDNVTFDRIGRVTRRKGVDLEDTGVYSNLNRTGGSVTSYVWLNAAGDGITNLLALQVGNVIRFYEASDPTTALSGQLLASFVDLTVFTPTTPVGIPAPADSECQFAQGNGFLFVFHPHLEPFYVSYNPITQTVTATAITVQIRDFAGIPEGLSNTNRPLTLTDIHRYNLSNQGWRSGYRLSSSTSNPIGTGARSFTTSITSSATPILAGDKILVYSTSAPSSFMRGIVTSFSGTSLVINSQSIGNIGTFTDWNITVDPDDILTWSLNFSNYPSNADVWWSFKNSSDVFSPATTILNVPLLNTAAPQGHYVVSPFFLDRSTASGIPTLTVETSAGERPSCGAFFSGRLFFAGTKTPALHNNIYFSQIIEGTDQFGKCYQENDPTAEDFFDLLPTDGGVISIQGAGTIIKMFATRSVLVIFATNGIWTVSGTGGTDGLGFAANDYSVNKVSNTKTLSATSFVEIQGVISWWAIEGIYSLQIDANNIKVESATNTTIASFYRDTIPNSSKLTARGAYNPITFVVQWVYRSTRSSTIEERYEFDKVLCFNTLTNAFYVWTLASSPTNLKMNGIVVVDSPGGQLLTNNVINGADNVVDNLGNQVITYALSSNVTPIFKYVISKPSGLSYLMSFGEEYKANYHDWVSENSVGVNYDSTFTTGYAVHGEAQKFFNLPWINVYEDDSDLAQSDSAYSIQGLWDFSSDRDSGKFSHIQRVRFSNSDYHVNRRRFRIRGKGMSLRLKFGSEDSFPFTIIGWSKWETKNPTP